jgi:lysophospholipase L1-like esterase
MLLRSYHGFFYDSFSADGGFTWSDPKPSSIKTTGSPGKMKRLASGRLALLHNAVPNKGFVRREELSLCLSDDDGRTWSPPQVIATNKGGRVSYPHLFEHTPGVLWITTMQGDLRVSLREADFIKDWTKIVCFGDSTTAPRDGVVIYADLLREGLSGRGIDLWVENSGVGSSHTDHARERFQRDVLDHRPKLAIIQFGINDSAVDVWRNPPAAKPRVALARYEENLNFFVDTLRERNCAVILMTPNPLRWVEKTRQLYGHPPYDPDDADGFNILLKDYAAAVRKIAAAKKVELIDVYALFESYDQEAGKSMDDLLLDGMHSNSTGHRLVADLLLEKIPRLLKSRAGGE